jgi:hypothetical protein
MAKWTRERIIREILRRDATGLSLALGGTRGVESTLYRAGLRVFGSWQNAVMAAGIASERARMKDAWAASKILSTIRSLSRRQRPPRPAELKRRYSHLVQAARRHFGSWSKAVIAAGVDPAKLRRVAPWTKERIIEAILTRALNNEPLGSQSTRPRSLAEAGSRVFGSWTSALAAAGVDPKRYTCRQPGSGVGMTSRTPGHTAQNTHRPGPRWSNEGVLEAILARLREQKRMNSTAVCKDDNSLYRAAKRRYGGWHNALLAAGLNPDECRADGGAR